MTRTELLALVRPLMQQRIAFDLAFPPASGLLRATSTGPRTFILRYPSGHQGLYTVADADLET